MSADEQRLFRLYGKLPNKKDLLQNKLKVSIFSVLIASLEPELTRLSHRSASTSTAAIMPSPKLAKLQTSA